MNVLRDLLALVMVVGVTAGCATSGPSAPDTAAVIKLMDTPLRDTSICLGPGNTYYMTGAIQPFWKYNEGVKLWKSPDLVHWEPLGMVWKYGDSPWHKKYLEAKKPLWAPEVHYLKRTFWLTYSMPGWDGTPKTSGSGLLRSATGKPEGPYVDVQPDERLGDEIDASLFEDTDGTVWFVWHSGKIAPMKRDMSGLAEPYTWLKTSAPTPTQTTIPNSAQKSPAPARTTTPGLKAPSCSNTTAATTSPERKRSMEDTTAWSPPPPRSKAPTANVVSPSATPATSRSSRTPKAAGGQPSSATTPPHPKSKPPTSSPSSSTPVARCAKHHAFFLTKMGDVPHKR